MVRELLVQMAPPDCRVWAGREERQERRAVADRPAQPERWVRSERWDLMVIRVQWVPRVLREVRDHPE